MHNRLSSFGLRWAKRAWIRFLLAAVVAPGLLVGCSDDDDGGGGVDQGIASQAYARGNGVVWLENKGSDFWTINRVTISPGGLQVGGAGTYELGPGRYTMSVSCTADSWKDQWGRIHHDTKASNSVGFNVAAGQAVHVILDSTGAGNEFRLVVAQ
jgi:hypothetical protein